MLQIASISPTDTTPLEDLFGKPNYNIVNELDGSAEPTLFDVKLYLNCPDFLPDIHDMTC